MYARSAEHRAPLDALVLHAMNVCAALMRALNDAVRALFVLSYMVVRALYFPYVVWGCYAPDMRAVLLLPLAQRKGQSDGVLWLPMFLGTAFSLLQLWWGTLLVKQLRKMNVPTKFNRQRTRRGRIPL